MLNSFYITANFVINNAADLVPGYFGIWFALGSIYIISKVWGR